MTKTKCIAVLLCIAGFSYASCAEAESIVGSTWTCQKSDEVEYTFVSDGALLKRTLGQDRQPRTTGSWTQNGDAVDFKSRDSYSVPDGSGRTFTATSVFSMALRGERMLGYVYTAESVGGRNAQIPTTCIKQK